MTWSPCAAPIRPPSPSTGQEVPFWTVATSADQLLGFFEANEHEAARITVNIDNVYSQLTGGLVINEDGPVTRHRRRQEFAGPRWQAAGRVDPGFQGHRSEQGGPGQRGEGRARRPSCGSGASPTARRPVRKRCRSPRRPSSTPRSPRGRPSSGRKARTGRSSASSTSPMWTGCPESETLISETTTVIAIDQIIAVGAEDMDSPGRYEPWSGQRRQQYADPAGNRRTVDAAAVRHHGRLVLRQRQRVRFGIVLGRIVLRRIVLRGLVADASFRQHRQRFRRQFRRIDAGPPLASDRGTGPDLRRRRRRAIRMDPAPSGTRWSGCGTTNPAGCGTRITLVRRLRHPAGPARFQDGARLAGRRRGAGSTGG